MQFLHRYSGFNFSHYELPFPNRNCIPYVRSGLYQLVIRVKGIPVCAIHCVREVTSFRIAFEVFSIGVLLSMQIHFFNKTIQSHMNYISENTYLQMTARAVTDESE